ncbi:penicillin-binding protein [Domibacillus aminovorans]|uniref:serine-type D-Ala-D-Ala carboxypeptidase n=1 Tax=Domibacillus aminovorans TaxID=29332 RepID=A0A177KM80_9BACI|nr:penicillin-binding transpeptidase domain-containing protein [Domibacillus aminovorans]OAH53681.1 penicillin-binding protein [Domibacillus aminovorans]
MIENRNNQKIGAAILFVGFALLFFILFSRVLFIQATGKADGHELKNEALEKYRRTDVLEAKRGTIYDANNEVIAEDTSSFTIAAILDASVTTDQKEPNHVTDPEKTAKVLAKYLDMEEVEILKRLKKDGDPFQVEFGSAGRGLSNSVKRKIEDENLPGITFIRQAKRFYPNGKFASHLIGFTQQIEEEGKDGKITFETEGQMGIEKSYEKYLKGKDGKIRYTSDLWGYLLPDRHEMVAEPEDGNDIYLTINSKIQTFLEDALNEVEAQYDPSKAFAIVAEAKTGKILAMSQRPTFHPGTREGLDVNWMNDLVEYSYEPGSTMKIFTLAAAIEEGVFNGEETYQSGTYQVGPNRVRDHNGGAGWGEITYAEGIQRSSNVAMAKLLEKMTPGVFRQYLEDFHFGQKTGIQLPNEASGSILYNFPLEQVTTSFGQGTTVTAMQMIQGATAIANNGKMMKPYVIDKIADNETGDTIINVEPEVVGEPISKKTADETLDVLETVLTAEEGTGKTYQIEGYDVAGKTGTAQLVGKDGKYLTGASNYLFSFMGIAPKDDPELIVYVAVAQPKLENESGSAPVSRIFNPVMRNSLQYLNVKPAENIVSKTVELKDFTGEKTFKAREAYEKYGVDPVIIGTGNKIVKQVPAAGEKMLQGEKAVLLTSDNWTMPDMTGWAIRDVMKITEIVGLKLSYSGTGYVISQNIETDSVLKEGQKLIVQLEQQGNMEEANEKAKEDSDQPR